MGARLSSRASDIFERSMDGRLELVWSARVGLRETLVRFARLYVCNSRGGVDRNPTCLESLTLSKSRAVARCVSERVWV